jgi:type III restriction enzyme
MIVLKEYGEEAVSKLIEKTKVLLRHLAVQKKTIVFQSPTGSGKTVMMAKYMERLCTSVYPDEPITFLWVSVGKGELHMQSKRALERYFDGYPKAALYEQEYMSGKDRLEPHTVTVINWEKLRTKDNQTKAWKNKAMKSSGDFFNFQEVMENTRRSGKLIMIIDESHLGMDAERTIELRDEVVKADLTIEMSATPKITITADDMEEGRGALVRVQATKVIEEGMIKREIVINDGVEQFDDAQDETTTETIVLQAAFDKRALLAQKYREAGSGQIHPLVLIQLPNSDAGLAKRESVEKWLAQRAVTVENKRLAIWLSEDKSDAVEAIEQAESPVEFLIFKQAIDTGWDCPRAAILVKFRETKSVVFEIQTVGRILRMPEQKHYTDDALNRGYVFTNIAQILVKKEEYNPNIIQTLTAYKRDAVPNVTLRSFYRKRTDLGVISSSFYPVFRRVFSERFGIDPENLQNAAENGQKLRALGLNIDLRRNTTDISKEGVIATSIFDTLGVAEPTAILTERHRTRQSDNDTQATFNNNLAGLLHGFAIRDSLKTLRKAIYDWFEQFLNIGLAGRGVIHIQNIVLRGENWEQFSVAIADAIEQYKPVRELEIKRKLEEIEYDWNIPLSQSYNEHTVKREEMPLHFHQPCFLTQSRSQIEQDFERYLEQADTKVQWWYKNGVGKKEYFGIRYEKEEFVHTFYPDFLVKCYDGRLGIFDTKAGYTAEGAKERAEALQAWISHYNKADGQFFGGIVVQSNQGKFKLNRMETYCFFKEDLREWEFLGDLF